MIIRELRLDNEKEIDDFLLDCCRQLATNKVNDKTTISGIIAENKAKLSMRISKLRGKKYTPSEELDNFKLNKNESIAKISAKFFEDMKKDMCKGEEYRFRDINIPDIVNSKSGEYLELKYKKGILYITIIKT